MSRSASFELLPGNLLTSLCESRCAEELEAIRTAIKEACTADTDVLVPEEDVAYPGTWIEMIHEVLVLTHVSSNVSC